jgi:hypothetical protein
MDCNDTTRFRTRDIYVVDSAVYNNTTGRNVACTTVTAIKNISEFDMCPVEDVADGISEVLAECRDFSDDDTVTLTLRKPRELINEYLGTLINLTPDREKQV